jgi:adenylate cyclase
MTTQHLGVIRSIRRRSRRLRANMLVAVALTAGAVGLTLELTGAFKHFELVTVDARFDLRGQQQPPAGIVVVGIDDATFDERGVRWPFPRSWHAQVIDRIRRAGAKVIGYDVQFTEPSPKGQEDEDSALFDAVERARGRILLAATETLPDGSTRVLGSDEFRRSLGARVGNTVTPSDINGVIRRLREQVGHLDTFALVAAEMARGRRVDRGPLRGDGAWIDFHGPPGTLSQVSFGAVRRGEVPPSVFRGKIVIVGAQAPSLQDVAATSSSGEELMSGPEILAEGVSTILRGFPLHGVPGWARMLLVLAMALVPVLAAVRLRPVRAAGVSSACAVVVVGGAQVAFQNGLIVPVMTPLATLVIGAVGALASGLVVEALERQRVRDVFAHFVPSSVVDDVLARAGDDLRLGGSERECTVLFSDLRGFTSYSEQRPPDEVIDVLNDYLGEMSDSILDHGGTLLAFMGDGIYAVFGAPLDQPDHRDRAVETARDMLARLGAFNERTGSTFRMGIGLNTGRVMCGNVGSERRLEYTAIGDTVNTASRLESMTKETGHQVHIADSTRAGLLRTGGLIDIGELPVRGRRGLVRRWGLAEAAPPAAQAGSAEGISTSLASVARVQPPAASRSGASLQAEDSPDAG